jgi:hypothetical protein
MIKKHLLIALGMAQMLLADEVPDMDCCPSVIIGEPLDPCCINPIYPYLATFSPCNGWDLYVKGEFLYLSSVVDNYKTPALDTLPNLSDADILTIKAPYRPGFRVSAGIDLGSAILDATYLRYHPHTTSNYSARENGGIVLGFFSPSVFQNIFALQLPLFQNVKISSHLSLDLGLISLSRPVYIGKRIMMNLNYGILGIWVGQKWRVDTIALNNPAPPVVTGTGIYKVNNKSWAVGPNLGFTATALLPCHFQVIGNIDLALQYGSEYKSDSSTAFPGFPSPVGNYSIRQNNDAAHLQSWHSGELGIGWGDYFCCNRYHVNLSISYLWLFQHIFLLNPLITPFVESPTVPTNFSMHGISISGRFDF